MEAILISVVENKVIFSDTLYSLYNLGLKFVVSEIRISLNASTHTKLVPTAVLLLLLVPRLV